MVSLQVSSVTVSSSIVFKCKEMNRKKRQFVSVSKVSMKHHQNISILQIMITTWLSLVLDIEHKEILFFTCYQSYVFLHTSRSQSRFLSVGTIQILVVNFKVKSSLLGYIYKYFIPLWWIVIIFSGQSFDRDSQGYSAYYRSFGRSHNKIPTPSESKFSKYDISCYIFVENAIV